MNKIATSQIFALLVLLLLLVFGGFYYLNNCNTSGQKTSLTPPGFPLNQQQILKYLRMANMVAQEAVKSGHPPFGAVLVGPDGKTVLIKQGNVSLIDHAETDIARRAFGLYDPDYLWQCTLVTNVEPCVMCAGNIYWANIGNVVYGIEEITMKKLTGADKRNPTMNLPCRKVFAAGQKPIRVVGPVKEMEPELLATIMAYWK